MNGTYNPVVVGVDGSASALHAVRWATAEAARLGTSVRLVHVTDGDAGHCLDEARAVATNAAPSVPVATEPRLGAAADVLIAESRSAPLMVLGSRGLGGAHTVVGSVAVAVAAHGHCPVVVMHARADGPPATGPVVVGVDGTGLSDAALTFAFEAAAAHDAQLVVVHTWLDVAMADEWTTAPADWEHVQAAEQKLLDERLSRWRRGFPGVQVRAVVRRDRADRALLEEAAGARLIVVGSHGQDAFAGMGVSSVSQTLLHHAECPVVIVRSRPSEVTPSL